MIFGGHGWRPAATCAISLLLMVFVGTFLFIPVGQSEEIAQENAQSQPVMYVPGEILVRYREGVSQEEGAARVKQLLKSTDYAELRDQGSEFLENSSSRDGRLPQSRVDIERYRQERQLRGVSRFRDSRRDRLTISPRAVESMAADDPEFEAQLVRINSDPMVELAIPNILIPLAKIPNDPFYKRDSGQLDQQTVLASTDIEEAWDIQTGSSDIVIAVLDTGIDMAHEDFAGKLTLAYDFFAEDDDPQDDDPDSHGTIVTGVAAATGNNDKGTAGVCWTCRVMPLRIGNNNFVDIAAAVEAIDYAVLNGARVINMSWGFYDWGDGSSANTISYLHSPIEAAWSAGVIMTAAAGNGNAPVVAGGDGVDGTGDPSTLYPAAFDEVIAVAAMDTSEDLETRADFSNYGDRTTIAAPGVALYTTQTGDEYSSSMGTSIATPVISGAAGLILSQRPDLTPSQVLQLLESGADSVEEVSDIGAGRVNIRNALPVAITTTSLPSASAGSSYSFTLKGIGGQGSTTWQAISGLPNGLSLSSSGKISGTPSVTSTTSFNVKVRLKDSSASGVVHEKTFPLTVNSTSTTTSSNPPSDTPSSLAISTKSLAAATVGKSYSKTLSGTGGVKEYSWSLHSGKLPPGLKLSKAGKISGKPTKLGSYTFTTRLKSADSQTANRKLTIKVDSSLRHPSGSLLKAKNDPTVWLLEGDHLKAFPTPTVYESHNYPWNAIVEVPASTIAIYPVGKALKIRSGTLVLTPGNPRVYLISEGKKHPFGNPDIFLGLGYSWDGIFSAQPGELNSYKTDSPMALNAARFEYSRIKSPNDATVYLLQKIDGKLRRRSIPSPGVFFSQGWDWPEIVVIPEAELKKFPTGPTLFYRDGSLIKGKNSPAVYVMENEKRRHIPSADIFLGRGYKWENIISIPESELAAIKQGKSM